MKQSHHNDHDIFPSVVKINDEWAWYRFNNEKDIINEAKWTDKERRRTTAEQKEYEKTYDEVKPKQNYWDKAFTTAYLAIQEVRKEAKKIIGYSLRRLVIRHTTRNDNNESFLFFTFCPDDKKIKSLSEKKGVGVINEKYYPFLEAILKEELGFNDLQDALSKMDYIPNIPYALENDKNKTYYIGISRLSQINDKKEIKFKCVDIENTTTIREWNYSVLGSFNARRSHIEKINSKIKLGSHVDISETFLTEWRISVPGNFNAKGSQLHEIGKKVKFGGDVDITNTHITEWHNNVDGNFNAGGRTKDRVWNMLSIISSGVIFKGNVDISYSLVEEWHNNVAGNFNAKFSRLSYVDPSVKFGGDVDVWGTNITQWHNDVPGDFDAAVSLLEKIDNHVKFEGNVDVWGTELEQWNNPVDGDFHASYTHLNNKKPKTVKGQADIIQDTLEFIFPTK